MGIEFEASTRLQETSVFFGCQLDLLKACSSEALWTAKRKLEKKLPPLPLTLVLGAFLKHHKNKLHCGFGFNANKAPRTPHPPLSSRPTGVGGCSKEGPLAQAGC